MNAALGCIECDWHCWVHSSYGTTEPPGDEWEAVQACDECSPLMPDWRAALIAAHHYGTRHLWVEPVSDGDYDDDGAPPGEWWVLTKKET